MFKARDRRDVERAIVKIHRFFKKQRFHPRGHVYLDRVVLAHISKALSLSQSILCLVEAGFPEEAFGLSRTLVEIALNLRFITNRYSERRAQRFVHYFARWKMELIRRTLKHFHSLDDQGHKIPTYTKTQIRKMMTDYKQMVKIARKYPNRTSWTETRNRKASKGGVWMMATEPDKYEIVQGVPIKWEFDYDWIYFWTSQYVHATVLSMDSHAVAPREAFAVRIAPERGQQMAKLAVFNVTVYLLKILVMAFRAIGHELPQHLANPLWNLLKRMARK